MNKKYSCLIFLASIISSSMCFANDFSVSSEQMIEGKKLDVAQEFNGFGCQGSNLSPSLYWNNAPANTQSFAITLYDPDAPTGSGFWHWTILNIPNDVNSLPLDAGDVSSEKLPYGARHVSNDFGSNGFGGACPPEGNNPHHYKLTIHALDTDNIDLPDDVSSAVARFMINMHEIDSTSITSHYMR